MALLAAALAPDAVRSLVVVEPAVWGIADPDSSPPAYRTADRDTWLRGPAVSAREFLIALSELYVGAAAAADVATLTSRFTAADWAAADTWRQEAWPGDAAIDVTGLAAAGFPKVVLLGSYDPAASPATAALAASGHLRALQAERRALARRINAHLVIPPTRRWPKNPTRSTPCCAAPGWAEQGGPQRSAAGRQKWLGSSAAWVTRGVGGLDLVQLADANRHQGRLFSPRGITEINFNG